MSPAELRRTTARPGRSRSRRPLRGRAVRPRGPSMPALGAATTAPLRAGRSGYAASWTYLIRRHEGRPPSGHDRTALGAVLAVHRLDILRSLGRQSVTDRRAG